MINHSYCLLYNPQFEINCITPTINLDQLIGLCNYTIKRTELDLDPGAANELARIVRLNYIYNDLQANCLRIVKPLFLNLQAFNLVVVQGDTRLMAANLCHLTKVPCLITVPLIYKELFPNCIQVENLSHFAELTNFSPDEIIITHTDQQLISNIDFNSAKTSHHMHDFDQRLRMIKNYLKTQPKDFEFTKSWCQQQINWKYFEVDKV
jgi:hypothetical protein